MGWKLVGAQKEGGGTYPELNPGLKLFFLSPVILTDSDAHSKKGL